MVRNRGRDVLFPHDRAGCREAARSKAGGKPRDPPRSMSRRPRVLGMLLARWLRELAPGRTRSLVRAGTHIGRRHPLKSRTRWMPALVTGVLVLWFAGSLRAQSPDPSPTPAPKRTGPADQAE